MARWESESCMVLSEYAEYIFIELYGGKSCSTIIGGIYRPPNLSAHAFTESLEIFLERDRNSWHKCYLVGDFNVQLLKYPTDSQSAGLINAFLENSFFPLVSTPTRVTKNCHSIIDNIFCNDTNILHNSSTYVIEDTTTDHFPILISLKSFTKSTGLPSRPSKKVIQINPTTSAAFKEALATEDWDGVVDGSGDCSVQFEHFSAIFLEHVQTEVMQPSRSLSKILKSWVTEELYCSMKNRNR